MTLTERLDVLILESAGDEGPFFYRLLDLTHEMAKRIEALEERLDAKERARGYAQTEFGTDQG